MADLTVARAREVAMVIGQEMAASMAQDRPTEQLRVAVASAAATADQLVSVVDLEGHHQVDCVKIYNNKTPYLR